LKPLRYYDRAGALSHLELDQAGLELTADQGSYAAAGPAMTLTVCQQAVCGSFVRD
jgi:hypothetical protein